MSDWYTITGEVTGDKYLVLVEERGLTWFLPRDFSLPFRSLGLSYYPQSGKKVRGSMRRADRLIRREIERIEKGRALKRRRAKEAAEFAARKRAET